MSGYTRQSVADIVPTAVVRAAPINAEYNKLRDAFAQSNTGTTGHKHDGTSDEGSYVPLIADTDAKNKVSVNTGQNRIEFYSEVSSAPVAQVYVQDGVILPVLNNDIDLGSAALKYKDFYLNGTASVGAIVAATADINAGTIDGTVIGGTTAAAGTFTDLTSTGTSTHATVDINGGAIDGTTIGAATPSTVVGTTITANTQFTGDLVGDVTGDVTGNVTGNLTGNVTGNVTSTGTSTFSAIDVNGGAIDGTPIGSSTPSTAVFSSVTSTGATISSADINGGTVDNTTIGATTPSIIVGTTVTANTGFAGDLTGDVTGNVTGALTGNVTGNITGDLTGDVTSTGTSTFNDVTINGTLNMNGATTATITNLTEPTNSQDAATKNYVDTAVSDLVDSAPAALDTLNELAAALGDDADFSTTITNSIATKLPLAGGTMSGDINMSTNSVTGLADPTANQDAATKAYVDTADATKLNLSGGTMTGNVVMGANKVTSTATPTADDDLTRKGYVDTILGSATAAATSAAAAATSESNAATSEANAASSESAAATSASNASTSETNAASSASAALTSENNAATSETAAALSETNAGTSETNAASSASAASTSATNAATSATNASNSASAASTSETNAATSESNASTSETNAATSASDAAASYDAFDDRYLGSKASAPTLDNDGNALLTGALYWNTGSNSLFIWTGSVWNAAAFNTSGALLAVNNLSDVDSAVTSRANLGVEIGVDVQAYDANIVSDASYVHTDNNYTTTEKNKLSGIEAGATGDQTASEIRVLVESATDSNVFTDADHTKLNGIETGADVTDAGNVNPLVDTHLNTSTATSDQLLSWTGSDYDWIDAGGGFELFAENPSSPTAPSATGANAVAIGSSAVADGTDGIAIGTNADAGTYSVSIGTGANGGGASNTVAIGRIGSSNFSPQSVVIGLFASTKAYTNSQTALGYNAKTDAEGAVALQESYAGGADSFAAAITNNTSSYGATGANSVAIGQTVKSTATAAVSIGRNAIASGQDSVAIGLQCTADASNSIALGSYSSTKGVKGRIAFSCVSSNYQQGTFVLAKQTSDATASVLTYNTASASTDNQIILPNNSAYSFSGTIIARESAAAGSDYASWEIKGALLRDANAASTVLGNGIQNKLYATSGASAWAIALTADTTNGGLKIEVTGAASTNIRWVATVNTSEVTYA